MQRRNVTFPEPNFKIGRDSKNGDRVIEQEQKIYRLVLSMGNFKILNTF